jgi:autotransporter-associated beta strand protein
MISGGTLGLTGTMPAISVTNQSDSATISAKIAGTSGLNVTGAGSLILTNSANTYSGGTNISTGSLQIGTSSIAGSIGSGDISVSSGGLLLLDFTVNNVLSNNLTNGVAGNGILNVNSTHTTTLTGTLTDGAVGQFSLTQGGRGTLILSNAGNSYSGTTTVVIGSLQIGTSTVAGSIGARSSVIVGDNGTLMLVNVVGNFLSNDITNALGGTGLVNVNSAHTTTLSGILSDGLDTLGLTQSGLGTTVLIGESTYSGMTTVSAGTLQVGNGTSGLLTGGGGIAVSGSGTLALDLADGTSFMQAVNLKAATATLRAIQSGTTTLSGVISGTGGVMQSGLGTTILSVANTYTGPTTISAGTFEVDGKLATASTVNVAAAGTLSGTGTINGKATLSGQGTIDLDGGTIAGTLAITGGSWTGTGTVNSAVTISSGAFNLAGTMTAPAGLGVTGGMFTGSGQLNGSLNYASIATSIFAGVIGDATSRSSVTVKKTGATLILIGANTYSGPTTISAGALQLGDVNAANSSLGTGTITVSGTGTLAVNLPTGSTFGRNVSLAAAGATFKTIQSGTTTISGVISGTGGVVEAGAGTTILSAANTYTGPTTISAGTLEVDGSLAAGSTVNIGTAGTLTGSGTINGKVVGNGTIDLGSEGEIMGTLKVSGGTWAGLGTVVGVVTVSGTSGASFTIASGETLTASGGVVVTAGTFGGTGTLLGNLTDTSSASFSYGGVIAGNSRLTMNNASATLTLANTNTYSGTTTVSAGTLQVGNGLSGSINNSGAVTVTGSGKLALDLVTGSIFSNAVTDNAQVIAEGTGYTIASQIAGSGSLVKAGNGTVTITGSNTYKGATTINAGTLLVNNTTGAGTGSGAVTVNKGATLGGSGTIGGAMTLTNGGVLEPGAGSTGVAGTVLHGSSIVWNGGGTLTLQIGSVSDELVLSGKLTKGSAGVFTIDILDAGIQPGTYTLVTFSATTFAQSNFTLELPANYTGTLMETSTSLVLENLTELPVGSEKAEARASSLALPASAPPEMAYPDSESFGSPGTDLVATPEPGGAVLLLFGGGIIFGHRRRRNYGARTRAR